MFDNNNTENYKMKNLVDISAMVTQSLNFFDIKDKIIEKSKRFLFKTGLITVARHLNKGKKVEVVENK